MWPLLLFVSQQKLILLQWFLSELSRSFLITDACPTCKTVCSQQPSDMPKRPHDSLAQTAASEDLIERLKAAANDAVRLREIVEGSDSVSIAAAFAVIFASDSSEDTNDEKRRKKISFCTCLDEVQFGPLSGSIWAQSVVLPNTLGGLKVLRGSYDYNLRIPVTEHF